MQRKVARGGGKGTKAARTTTQTQTGTAGTTQSQTEGASQSAGPASTESATMAGQTAGATASSGAGANQDASKSTPQDNSPASSAATNTQPATAGTTPAPPKRQRVSRACDQCRAMREKCDGAQPHCSSCVSQHRACTYKTSPKKRGVQTGYIRTLELTLSSLLDEVPGCADALDGLFGRHGGDAAQRLFNPEVSAANPAQQQKDLERHNRLHRRWHKSRARREINRLLSTDGFSAGVSRPLSDRAGSDEDTDQEAAGSGGQNSRPAGVTSAVTWSPSENTIPSPLSGHDDPSFPLSQPSRTPLPPNHWRLLDVYFSYTHCWFPILERQDVLKAVYQYERELGEPTSAPAQSSSSTSAATAELWSVLALASFQDAAARKQAQHNDPTQTPSTSTSSTTNTWPSWPPHRIYNIARQMIPLDDGPFEVQHARALLLLALVNIGRRRYTAARVLVSLARQIVQDADCLSRVTDYNHGQHGYGPMSMRRRIVDAVTSGCSILDAFVSIVRSSLRQPQPHQQHPTTIRHTPTTPQHQFYPPAVPEDGLDEWQPWVPCIGFGVEDAASERSPAYSLTTFNQLHALFTCMQQQAQNQGHASSPTDYNDVIAAAGSGYTADGDALDRVLRPDVPFSAFVRSNERLSAAVPSAYILRITYLWMQVLLSLSSRGSGQGQRSDADARIHLLADVLEQFVARFGAAGAPPTFVSCVLTVVEHPSFKLLPPPLQQRLCVLGDSLEAVWHVPEQQTQGQKQQQQQLPMPAVPTTTPRSNAVLRQKLTPTAAPTSNPPVAVYQSASPEAAVVHQQQQQQRPARHHRMSFLEPQSQQTQPPPPQTQQTPDVNMYNGSHQQGQHPPGQQPPAFGFHQLPISPPTAGTVGSDHHSSTNYPAHSQPIMATPYNDGMAVDNASGSFDGPPFSGAPGSNTLDYEALLDDLSAVDYLDRLDADIGPQFMANLGFAPGMDNNLIWNP